MTPLAIKLFSAWHAGQGAKIKGARPMPVYGQCVMLAKDLANKADGHVSAVLLTIEHIGQCEQRALSSARVARFGPPPASEEAWREQINAIRQAWADGEVVERVAEPNPTKGKPFAPVDSETSRRLAELAAAKREGRPPAEQRDIPEARVG